MDIVEEIQNDPEKGAKRLESEYRAGLMTLALRFCHDPGDAAELVNRTFAEVVTSIDNYAEQSAFFGWMSKILVNLHAKDVRRKSNGEIVYPGEVPETADESAHEDIFRNVDASQLRDAIETLPNDIRQTLMMHYFMDLSVAQVAKILSVPGGTVKWRLHYARQILATKLGAAAKNPKGKALLIALALAALTAVGATVATIVGETATGGRLQPAAEGGRELSASGSRLQSAAESDLDPSASGGRLQSATGCRLLSAPDTSTSPMTGDTMSTTKTTSTLAAAALALTSGFAPADAPAEMAALPAGITITISNFDEDLATVYVNGTAATNGETRVLADGESLTLELRDFRSDWYFAYAPDSQTDRTLALESWGGLPDGVDATANPVTFTPDGDLTVTPNVDCKGHVWIAYGTTVISNAVYKIAAGSFNATTRSLSAGQTSAYYSGDKVLDYVMRVRKDGVNYTITATAQNMLRNMDAVRLRLPPRLASIGQNFISSTVKVIEGLGDTAVTTLPMNFLPSATKFDSDITNYVPRGMKVFGSASDSRLRAYCYSGQSNLKGPLILQAVEKILVGTFANCSGVTELYSTSPRLTTIAATAFQNASALKKVTLASPVLSSVASDAFNKPITNLTYLSAPPASQSPLDNILAGVAAADGAHNLKVHLPLCTPGWWDLVSEPTAAEVAAGLPEGCYGVYVTEGGARKGWVIATDDPDASLVVTDMSHSGNAGYEIHAGLAPGATLALARDGYSSYDLQHFNRGTGAWETFATVESASANYTHDGRLTRLVWKNSGVKLSLSAGAYSGTFTVAGASPVVGDNIYAPGAVLTISAAGSATHPTSHFAGWISGVADDLTNSATITVTLNSDTNLVAAFAPDEWLHEAATGKITDGYWTSSAAVTLDATAKSVKVGGFTPVSGDYTRWLDLSLPVYVPSDPESEYAVTELTVSQDNTLVNVRVGPRFNALRSWAFRRSTVLSQFEGLGASCMTVFPECVFDVNAAAPICSRTYEANDFIPESLVLIAGTTYAAANLAGTLSLPKLTTFNGKNAGFISKTAGVTNLYLTCEALTSAGSTTFSGMRLQELTIGATNLASAVSGSFSGGAATLERMNFLAHAPAAAALNNILASYNARTTTSAKPLEIRCSKYAPGWRELAAAVDRSSEEWRARPASTWGIYQTAAGTRFYLVQRDSKYDKNPFTLIIMR
ncbi:MAG: sigma-70 family RNA polymerase sigma factor [Kiritimatiellae bacterium]|nr:sigma-70 family RNA polymerase sigma factor [Kiritimatiellia bacterium]